MGDSSLTNTRIYLFGNPRILINEKEISISRKKSLALLAYISLKEIKMSRSQIANILLPDKDESHSRGALRTALSTLNSECGETLIKGEGDYISFDGSTWVDVVEFRKNLKSLERNTYFESKSVEEQKQAVSLYTGDFLSGFYIGQGAIEFEDWQYLETENLKKLLARALERLIQSFTLTSDFKTATTYAEKWTRYEPLDENAHRRLIELYAWQGRKGDSLHQYEKCKSILKNELDIEPEESTENLYNSIKSNRLQLPEKTNGNDQNIPLVSVLDSSVYYSTIISIGLTNSAEKILIQRPYDTASMIDILFHKSIEEILKKHSVTTWFFVGDALISIFGIPNSVADDSYHAVIAAIEIMQIASDYGFIMTAGIATGLVYLRTGESPYNNSSISGPAVTEANLLRFFGDPGMIFVENATWTNTKSSVVFEKLDRSIPGMSRTKEIFRLRMGENDARKFI